MNDGLADNAKYAFGDMFIKSKAGPIRYKNLTLIMADKLVIPVKRVVNVQYRIVSTNSEWPQGIAFSTDGWLSYRDGEHIKRGWFDIFEQYMPKEDVISCYSTKSGILWVKNVWDQGEGGVESGWNGAAMWIEQIPGGKRYHCNDGHFDDDFNELVFELRIENAE